MLLLLLQISETQKLEHTSVALSGWLAATNASRMSRSQSQFVGRERHALSLTSFQNAAARERRINRTGRTS